jgi:Rho-binding antiterminator
MERPYVPISCAFYDELLALAGEGRGCEIRYRDDAGEEATVRARIQDVFSRAGAEFVLLDSGATLRLDRLIEVAGRPLPPSC